MKPESPEAEQARQLAERARSLFGEAQEGFLEDSCAGDTSLRTEVEALLAADALARGGTLPAESMPADVAAAELAPGHQLGPYRVLELLGEGGFGSVYLAEQREPIRRRVALKVIKLGMDTRQVIARFEAERQALAMMTHSNIAHILDVGATEAGRLYFVMELVSGVPITEFCQTQQLGVDERLKLFEPVCNALQHAHSKGVIHRDIKPSNILVTVESDRPVPKVIDFGIAKATLENLTDDPTLTLEHQFIGTPAYMPPEQAEWTGLAVDTRSDIYALGVLLYELLTGSTPFDRRTLHEVGRTEMLRIIREVEPRRPSTRVMSHDDEAAGPRRPPEVDLSRRLRGDLDWIVMKCLEKDPTRRYETASELAADIRRHLADEPVLAGAPSATYRLRKFARRNRAGVLAGAVALTLLLVAVVGTTWGWLEAEHARADTQQRAGELQKVVGLQEAQLRKLDGEALGLSLRDQLLALAAERAERDGLSPEDAAASAALLETHLAGLDFTDLALGTVIEGVLDPTLQAVREEFGDQPLVRARMEQALATVFLSMDLHERAEAPQRSALDTRRAELGPEHAETLESLHQLGLVVAAQGRLQEALGILEACLQGRQGSLGPEHRDSLSTANSIAVALQGLGRLDEARKHHERLLEARLRLFGEDDADTLKSMSALGETMFHLNEWAEAEELSRRALEGRRALPGDHRLDTWTSMNNLSILLRVRGDFDAALPLMRDVHQSARSHLGDRHRTTLVMSANLGSLLRDMGNLDEAETYLEHVLSTRRILDGDSHPDTLDTIRHLGLLRFDQNRREEADNLLELAWLGMRRFHGEAHQDALEFGAHLGKTRVLSGRLMEAEHVLVELAHIARRKLGSEDRRIERALANVDDLLNALQRHFGTLSGPSDETLACLNAIAGAQNAVGHYTESQAVLAKGLPIHEQAGVDVSARLLAESRSLLGEAAAGQERWDEAEVLLLKGFRELDHPTPEGDQGRLIRSGRRLARFYEDSQNPESADIWWKRVHELEEADD